MRIYSMDKKLPLYRALFERFSTNTEMRKAARLLARKPQLTAMVARELFPESDEALADAALVGVVSVGVLAKPAPEDYSLLPARHHLSATGIEGMTVKLGANSPNQVADFRPGRPAKIDGENYYSLIACRNCGEPFVEAWRNGEFLEPERTPGRNVERMVLRVLTGSADETLESDEEDQQVDLTESKISFDPKTGKLGSDQGPHVQLLETALEYAPGAEVVSGHRVWVSEGIARYPQEFMPKQWAANCELCGHVDHID